MPTANVENYVAGSSAGRVDGGLGQRAPTGVEMITEQKPSRRVLPGCAT